jgi:hypothetical protein
MGQSKRCGRAARRKKVIPQIVSRTPDNQGQGSCVIGLGPDSSRDQETSIRHRCRGRRADAGKGQAGQRPLVLTGNGSGANTAAFSNEGGTWPNHRNPSTSLGTCRPSSG